MPVAPITKALDDLISNEIQLHHGYVKALELEQQIVISGKTEGLAVATAQRERFIQGIARAQDARFTLMRKELGEPEFLGRQKAPPPSIPLSQFVKRFCHPSEAKVLIPKIDILRELVSDSQTRSREYSQVVAFSLRMIGGLASILWSATKHVVRSYTPGGTMKESTHDGTHRKSGVLKEI